MLMGYVESQLGEVELVARPRTRGRSRVVEVIDAEGHRWFAKHCAVERHFRGEVNAHNYWLHDLVDRSPRLHHAAPRRRALIMSAVPGTPVDEFDGAAYQQAGALLRRFHNAAAERAVDSDYWARLQARVGFELARCRRLGVGIDEDFVRGRVGGLRELTDLVQVPCHGDFLPHNWLKGPDEVVRIIDFAEATFNVGAADFARLRFGPAWRRPDLMDAFLQGYGRTLTEQELRFIELHLSVNAVTAIAWGTLNHRATVRQRGLSVLARLAAGHTSAAPQSAIRRQASRVRDRATRRRRSRHDR